MRKTFSCRRPGTLLLLGMLLVIAVTAAHAQQPIPNGGVLNTVRGDFQAAIAGWGANIQAAASRLFWTLAIISMVWTFGMMALRKAEFQEVIMELLRFAITLGLFLWLLTNGTQYALSIVNGLSQLGQQASGLPAAATPSGIMSQGWQLWGDALASASYVAHPIDALIMLLTAVIIVIVFALIAVNYLLLTITAWLVAYAGIFMLGFGGSRWTSDLAIQYFKTALGIGLQIMTMILLVAVGWNFMQAQIAAIPPNGVHPTDLAAMLVAAIILLELTNKVPPLVASMAGASTGGIGQHGAGTVMGVAAAGVAAASMAGSAVMAGVRGAAGGASAVMAAYKAAGDGGGESGGGRGAGSSMSGGFGGDEQSGGAGSLSEAMGGSAASVDAGGGGISSEAPSGGGSGSSGAAKAAAESGGGGGASPGGDTRAASVNADQAAASVNADEVSAAAGAAAEGAEPAQGLPDGSSDAHATAGNGAGAGIGARLRRTAAILASGTMDTAVNAAKKSIGERTIGGKIATTISAKAAAQRLSAAALQEVEAFVAPKVPDSPKAPEA